MLTVKEAAKIGIDACIERLGRSFVEQYAETSSSAYGEDGSFVFCFVGVDTEPEKNDPNKLILSGRKFPYRAESRVSRKTGECILTKCVRPRKRAVR